MSSMFIMGRDYRICPAQVDASNPINDKCPLGYIDYNKHIIYINVSQQNDMEAAGTMLHEIIHAISYYTELELEEKDVNRISNMIFGVMLENGADLTWLKAGE